MRPRIRSVKPEMRQDERYASLSYPGRELFNGMITMADDEGRFRALTSGILGHVFPYDDDAPRKLRGWVAEIKATSMVLFYVDGGTPYGAFRHWARHQKINRPSPSDLPPPPDGKIVADNGLVQTDRGWKQAHGLLTEVPVNGHGAFTESSLSTHPLTRGCAFRSDPKAVKLFLQNGSELTETQRVAVLCLLLAAHVRSKDPKADPNPDSAGWLNEMRLLVAARGDVDEVARIIDWCQADGFWRCNVLSPAKLRKQFTQLVLKAAEPVPALHAVSRRDQIVAGQNAYLQHYPKGAA